MARFDGVIRAVGISGSPRVPSKSKALLQRLMDSLARYGADLRTPVGPIRFACSDMAGKGYQHVDGAIRVGREVADEILAADELRAAS